MRRLAAVLMTLVLLAMAGCAGKQESGAPTPSGSPEKPAESKLADTIRFSSSADATTLDPHDITDNQSESISQMLYDRLVKFDEKLNIVPDLAEKWEVSPDGKTWTFTVRTGVKFHDGTDFDAVAAKKSFDRVLDPNLNLKRRSLFSMIKEIQAPDARTITFTTNEPFGAFLATLAHSSAAVVSPTAADKLGKDFGKNPVGTGAYKFVDWKKDEALTIERFDGYWGTKALTKRIVYKPIKETASRVVALQTGETDIISHVPATDLKRFTSDSAYSVLTVMSNGQRQFRFNFAKPVWKDPKVRQAVSYAIDRKAIVQGVMGGQGQPSVGPLSPVTWGAPNFGEIAYDPDKAKKLLAEAGYPNGFSIKITTTPRYEMGVELAEALGAQLAKVGIQSKLEVLEWGVFVQGLSGKKPSELDWDLFIMGAGPSTGDADWGLRPIFTTHPTNENNYGFYSNKEFDDLIFAAMRETDQAKRKELYRRAGEIVYLTDPGAVWLFDNPYTLVASSKVKDVMLIPLSHVLFNKATMTK